MSLSLSDAIRDRKIYLRGYAAALADLIRMHGIESEARDAINGSGLTVEELKAAGVEDYDLDEIRKAAA